jgi:hypothetical protein
VFISDFIFLVQSVDIHGRPVSATSSTSIEASKKGVGEESGTEFISQMRGNPEQDIEARDAELKSLISAWAAANEHVSIPQCCSFYLNYFYLSQFLT